MTIVLIRVALAVTVFFMSTAMAHAASWRQCDGVPVRRADYPVQIHINSCSIPSETSPEFSSAINGEYEIRTYAYLAGLPFTPGDPCVMNHSNGVSEVGLVDPSQLDGRLGLTLTKDDGCAISEADVMVSNQLLFAEPDESFVLTSSKGTQIGRIVMLHELGHSIGLEHSSDFAVMRNGRALVPFHGRNQSGGSVHFVSDDIFGIRNIYRLPLDYPNLFASGQWLDTSAGMNIIRNINVDPATNQDLPGTVSLCPGQKLSFFVTIGSQSMFSRTADVRVYADTPDFCTALDGVGTELLRISVTVNRYSTFSFPVTVTIPSSIPRNRSLRIYTAIDPNNQLRNEARSWDDCVRTALTLVVGGADRCGM